MEHDEYFDNDYDDFAAMQEESPYDPAAFEALHAQRALKIEQDHEFEESARIDAEKTAKKDKEQRDKEMKRRRDDDRARELDAIVASSPTGSDENNNVVVVRVATPDDGVKTLAFLKKACLSECHRWISATSDRLYTEPWTFASSANGSRAMQLQNDVQLSSLVSEGERGLSLLVIPLSHKSII